MRLNTIIPSTRAGEELKPSLLISIATEGTIAIKVTSELGDR
jgi:hypothetical protein